MTDPNLEPTTVVYESGKSYETTYAWGRGYVISDTDAVGDWMSDSEVEGDVLASIFD